MMIPTRRRRERDDGRDEEIIAGGTGVWREEASADWSLALSRWC
jgi:hypothetical protein